jgi:protein-tyrosine-phosphatase
MHVTFVCEANQARSPVAAALLRAELQFRGLLDADAAAPGQHARWSVDSAGIHASNGMPTHASMVAVAGAFAPALAEHRSRPLDEQVIAVADLILTMTRDQADAIGARISGVVARCFVLDELVALLDAVATVPVPNGDPSGEHSRTGLPAAPRQRIAAAHARRPFRRPEAVDDISDPLVPGSAGATATYARLQHSVTALARLLLDPV